MVRALYLTHPEVLIDPVIPTPLWQLSPLGRQRAEAFARAMPLPPEAVIFSSTERKALDLAAILAEPLGLQVIADPAFGENDRSATGFLPPPLFEETADRFFAQPDVSIEGWERAIDAQARIVAAVGIALKSLPEGRLAVFAGHGAVGTLLKCALGSRPISRHEDQGRLAHSGGGNAFSFETDPASLITDWISFEAFEPALLGHAPRRAEAMLS
jgi:broad specificity phosphatase PhoE